MEPLHDSTETIQSRSSWLRPIPLLLIVTAIAGAVVSFGYSKTLAGLRQEHQDLVSLVGTLDIDDPSRVYITAVSTDVIEMPQWIEDCQVWTFRVHIPPNYAVSFQDRRGLIAENSPRGSSNGGGSWGSADKESKEIQIVLTLVPTKTGWQVCHLSSGGSSTSSLPPELKLDSMDDYVVEPVVGVGEPTKSFSADEPICLFRLRSKTPGKPRRNKRSKQKPSKDVGPLYPGYVLYLLEGDRRGAFNDWANGKTDRMAEPQR